MSETTSPAVDVRALLGLYTSARRLPVWLGQTVNAWGQVLLPRGGATRGEGATFLWRHLESGAQLELAGLWVEAERRWWCGYEPELLGGWAWRFQTTDPQQQSAWAFFDVDPTPGQEAVPNSAIWATANGQPIMLTSGGMLTGLRIGELPPAEDLGALTLPGAEGADGAPRRVPVTRLRQDAQDQADQRVEQRLPELVPGAVAGALPPLAQPYVSAAAESAGQAEAARLFAEAAAASGAEAVDHAAIPVGTYAVLTALVAETPPAIGARYMVYADPPPPALANPDGSNRNAVYRWTGAALEYFGPTLAAQAALLSPGRIRIPGFGREVLLAFRDQRGAVLTLLDAEFRWWSLRGDGTYALHPIQAEVGAAPGVLRVPGHPGALAVEIDQTRRVVRLVSGTGLTHILSLSGELSRAATEADLQQRVATVRVPGFPGALAVDLDLMRRVVRLTEQDGSTHAISRAGGLSRVMTEADRLTVAQDALGVPGRTGVRLAQITQSNGRAVAAVDTYGRPWAVEADQLRRDAGAYYDVVVYGSGLPALTAMRAAAQLGASVCLICPDERLGGMMSGGISILDTPQNQGADWTGIIGGLTLQFILDIGGKYGARLGAAAYSGDVSILRRFEPRIAEMVANEWAARYADRVILNCQIEAAGQQVVRDGTTTRGIVTPQGIIRCGQVVEASYTGDVLRAAGISWTWTREAASAAEPYGGWKLSYGYRATGVDMTDIPPAAFEKFGARVVSGISDPSLPATGTAVPGVMGYNIRNIMTDAPDRIRFEDLRPADYDRERYLLPFAVSVRFSNDQTIQDVIGFQDEEAGSLPSYAGDGSAIFNANSAGVYNTNILARDYPIATWARRREIERDVVNYNLGLYYFFATDSIVPESIRASFAAWGLSPREWIGSRYGTGVPHKVYDRQTIRMVNDAVMTEADVKVSYTAGAVPDPIGLFNYFIDRKVFNFVAWNTSGNLWTLAEEGGGVPDHDTATYAIPLRILLPRAAEATNVTVAWCVAVTDHVWSSLRMELNGGIQGEAAGVVAALAARRGVPVQSIPYADVRAALRSLGATIR